MKMKQFKLSSKRKTSGQVVVVLIILVALLCGAWWWLNSNKENSAKEGTDFAKEAVQKIAVQHDGNFFISRLSPQMRMVSALLKAHNIVDYARCATDMLA